MRISAGVRIDRGGRRQSAEPAPARPQLRLAAAEAEQVWTRPAAAGPVPVWTRPTVEMPIAAPARFEAPPDGPAVVVTAIGGAEGSRGAAAALACAGADGERAPLLVDLGGRPPRPTLLASAAARALEERLVAHLPLARVAARGQVCHLAAPAAGEGFERAAAAATVARGALAVVHVPPSELQALLADPAAPRFTGALLRADVGEERALLALVVRDLLDRGLAVAVLKRRLSWVTERRALFGALGPDPQGLSPSLLRRLVQYPLGGEYGAGS
jgi:hypothetical protein